MVFLRLFSRGRRHYLLLVLVFLLGALVRFWNLTGLPVGVHGDEGIVGYEARRILETGSIGPYSTASLGQPTGPIYLVAPFVAWWGNEILAARFVPALVGTLSVLALYALVRPRLGRSAALLSAFVLAFLTWHVHYARIAFPLESWPLAAILVVWALLNALEKPSWSRFAFAGFVNGLGVYVYKAHPFFALIASVWGLIFLLKNPVVSRKDKLLFSGVYAGSVLIAANFLIRFALQKNSGYGGQFELTSVFNQPDFVGLGENWASKIWFLLERYIEFWRSVWGAPKMDGMDGAGVVPLVPMGFFLLFLVGFFAVKERAPLLNWARVIVVLMPLAHVITIDAFARRTIPLAPFLCVLAGAGALQIFRFGAARGTWEKIAAPAGVAMLLVWGAGQFARDYFGVFALDPRQSWVFTEEFTRAIEYAKTLPPQTPIYFFSGRWSVHYDTRKFLAPDLNALDASREHSPARQELWPTPRAGEKPVWIFLRPYESRRLRVQNEFPGGKAVIGPPSLTHNGQPCFWAYETR